MSDPWAGIDIVPRQDDGLEHRRCPWCSREVGADALTCPSCGAAVAQRESIGGLVLPGITSVDQAYDGSVSVLTRTALVTADPARPRMGVRGGQGGLLAATGAVVAGGYLKRALGEATPGDPKRLSRSSEPALRSSEALDRGEPLDNDEPPVVAIPIEPDSPNGPESGEY